MAAPAFAPQRIRVGVVYALSVAVELVAKKVVVETSVGSSQRRVAVGRPEVSSIGAKTEFRDRKCFRCASKPARRWSWHRSRTTCSARPRTNSRPIGLRQRQRSKIKRFARFTDVDPIDNHFVVCRLPAAQNRDGNSAKLPRSIHDRAVESAWHHRPQPGSSLPTARRSGCQHRRPPPRSEPECGSRSRPRFPPPLPGEA